jgi:acyl-CoA synthetase (AMP-forming)/AMP-acid ligase II
MSLLDCICCCRHHLRTAVCWDSPDESSSRFLTYSFLFEQADVVCTTLRSFSQSMTDIASQEDGQSPPVAIYGRSCPEVLCALLGVMSLPAPYMPLDLSQPVVNRWSTMQECGVRIVLIELSLFSVSITYYYTGMC